MTEAVAAGARAGARGRRPSRTETGTEAVAAGAGAEAVTDGRGTETVTARLMAEWRNGAGAETVTGGKGRGGNRAGGGDGRVP